MFLPKHSHLYDHPEQKEEQKRATSIIWLVTHLIQMRKCSFMATNDQRSLFDSVPENARYDRFANFPELEVHLLRKKCILDIAKLAP